jgi:hypothetical protein
MLILIGGIFVSGYSIDVHLYMEKGMYARLVERGQELGVPLSAVVREAVVEYFENIPEVPEQGQLVPQPDDPIWQLPGLSASYGKLSRYNLDGVRVEAKEGQS